MNDREQAVNQDLQILGDAYRLRQIRREEYRLRRRHVLAGLRGRDEVETARKPLQRPAAGTAGDDPFASGPLGATPSRPDAPRRAAPARAGIAWKYWLLFAFGVAVVAAVAWALLRSPEERAAGPAARSLAVASDETGRQRDLVRTERHG